MILQANGNQKKVDVAILISDKIDFKPKCNRRQKWMVIIIKGAIHQAYMTVINMYALT